VDERPLNRGPAKLKCSTKRLGGVTRNELRRVIQTALRALAKMSKTNYLAGKRF